MTIFKLVVLEAVAMVRNDIKKSKITLNKITVGGKSEGRTYTLVWSDADRSNNKKFVRRLTLPGQSLGPTDVALTTADVIEHVHLGKVKSIRKIDTDTLPIVPN